MNPHPTWSLWRPHSNCGPECLPDPGTTPRASGPVRLGRLAALVGVLLFGAALVPVLPLLARSGRQAAGRTWARAVLRSVGIGLDVQGRPPRRRALLVANHVSWLDVVTILAVTPARMLAKHEVRRWPLIGPLAALGGVIFVDRTRPRTLPATVAQVGAALRADDVVAVFPEGTTWCGLPRPGARCGAAGRFRPAMFQAAIDADAPVVPVHLGYRVAPSGPGRPTTADATGGTSVGAARAGGTTAPAFLAQESLLSSVRRVLALRGLVVTLTAVDEPRLDEPWIDGSAETGVPTGRRGGMVERRRLAVAAEAAVRAVGSPGVPPLEPGPEVRPETRAVQPEALELAA
ncbi:lysophospholipid acyltransferase family protein [Plantactinospora soyae]|uniref:1-acyl-sn-glycerol-3-phosphate acyltransferase n=1 Tax=Plantactinospora soyae TaxID=1544732 RepID=A0A927M5V9_9ACTN|nr:lysophospholipid acyltransferase family protein [Plantactinospora soyae]MBE1487191.1 1-acyl-sn-glycerol-3-phosphate acyltransferase [Plantactinospora soyae]